jgi:protein O-mannosyl-transferase
MSKTRRGKATVESKPLSLSYLCLTLALLVLIFYGNSLRTGLLSDSNPIIREDPRLRALTLSNIQKIFTEDYWWPTRATDLYRPLTTATYLINYTILGGGENPAGYHAVNLILHWINACLVLIVLRRLAGRNDIAILAACIFVVHPVNTEAVTNVVGRADLLATACVLFGGWCYLRAMEPGDRKKYWLTLMGATACLGVLAKENAVMIVAFIGIYDVLYRQSFRSPARYLALIPSLALISIIRIWMQGKTLLYEQVFVDNPLIGSTFIQRWLTATAVIGRYLKLLIFPRTLSADYSFSQIRLFGTGDSASDMLAVISFVVIVLLLAAAIWLWRREPIFSWGILFFFVMLLPTSNLLIVIGSIMAERFLYLPSIGFCAVAALGICKLRDLIISRAAPRWHVVAVQSVLPVLILCIFGIRTIARNTDWRDELSLWKSGVAASPNSFRTHMGYGSAIWNDAQRSSETSRERALDHAIAEDEIAQSILEPLVRLPSKWQSNLVYLSLSDVYTAKADLLNDRGRQDEAMNFYKKSIDVLLKARELDRATNEASREFRLRQGVPREEIFDVGNFAVYKSLGYVYCRLQQWTDCESAARYLEHLAPDEPTGYLLYGTAVYALQRETEATVHFLAGVLLDPANVVLWKSLQAAYNKQGLSSNPVISNGSSYSLNAERPMVRQQLNAAAVMLVERFEDAKRFEPARQAREQFIKRYAVPREAFSHNTLQ